MRWSRVVIATCLSAAALASGARPAGAQALECDPGDQELRGLEFVGNHAISDGDLALRINTTPSSSTRRILRIVGAKRCLDHVELGRDAIRLKILYKAAGYWAARIDTVVVPKGKTGVKARFLITEGPPIRIESFAVSGLDSVPERGRILAGLWTRPGRPYNTLRLRVDEDSIISRLRNVGYPLPDLARSYSVDSVAGTARLELQVITGRRARFGTITLSVDSIPGKPRQVDDRTVLGLMNIEPGAIYRHRQIAQSQRNLYQTSAYRHVEVSPVFGDSTVPDTLVPLHVKLVEDYMRELNTEFGWALFDCFRARAQLSDKNFLGGARRLELSSQLSKVGFGAPLRFSDAPRKALCYSGLNHDQFSDTVNYYLGATIRDPLLFGIGAAPVLRVYTERHSEYLAYLRTTLFGGEATLNRNLGRLNTPLRLGYTFEYGRTQADAAVLCFSFQRCDEESRNQITGDPRPIAVASAGIVRNRTDNPLAPSRGSILRFEYRTSNRLLGSHADLTFNKSVADGSFYLPGGWGNVIALRVRGGMIFGGTLSGTDSAGRRLPPPQERLYAGGPGSVRGYQQNELGELVYIVSHADIDTVTCTGGRCVQVKPGAQPSRTAPVGGNSLLVANLEYRFRLPWLQDLVQFTGFVDAGNVWNRGFQTQQQALTSMVVTPGMGVRVFSPLGPIQVNVGYNSRKRVAGAAYYEQPVALGGAGGQLQCVSPGNGLALDPVTGAQAEGTCPSGAYAPRQPRTFVNRLVITFSIGPDF